MRLESAIHSAEKGPVEVAKEGNVTVPIHATTNRIYRINPANGARELKNEHPQLTVIFHEAGRALAEIRKVSAFFRAYRRVGAAAFRTTNNRDPKTITKAR